MASPWKFLARLVSPRRQRKQDDGAIKDVKSDVSAMAEPTKTNNLNLADQPTRGKTHSIVHSERASAQPKPLVETGSDIQGKGESGSEERANTTDPALPEVDAILANAAPKVETVKAEPAKKRGRAKPIEVVAVVSQTSPLVPTISDEMSLDQEIRILRDQLASKLRLQNAQLKKMLERFDR